MSDTKAKELGLTPRAKIVTAATWGNEPEYMGVAPIGAIKKALDRAGMTIDDVGTVELNEAFAAQVIPIMDECDIPLEKLNTHGGAIALGHPFGMTGARIMGTLLNVMETDDHQVGIETMCVAGGQGNAMIVERLQLRPWRGFVDAVRAKPPRRVAGDPHLRDRRPGRPHHPEPARAGERDHAADAGGDRRLRRARQPRPRGPRHRPRRQRHRLLRRL